MNTNTKENWNEITSEFVTKLSNVTKFCHRDGVKCVNAHPNDCHFFIVYVEAKMKTLTQNTTNTLYVISCFI